MNVKVFLDNTAELTHDEFCAQFAHPFLVGVPGVQALTETGFHTQDVTAMVAAIASGAVPAEAGLDTAAMTDHRVYPIAKRPESPFPKMITVGRSHNNDIPLTHVRVSKLHAYFQQDPETGLWGVRDSGSTNGTRLNGKRLAHGNWVEMADQDLLGFADVTLTFFSPQSLYAYLPELRRVR